MTPAEWLVTIKVKNALAEARRKGIQNVIDHKQTGGSNRYCAWVSSSRRYTEQALFRMFSSVECASGGRTKFNREQLGLPKDHHYDALCVGTIPTDGYKDFNQWSVLCRQGNRPRFSLAREYQQMRYYYRQVQAKSKTQIWGPEWRYCKSDCSERQVCRASCWKGNDSYERLF